LADFDGNGRTDLLSGSPCCQRPNCFYVFRRQEDGSFGQRETIPLAFAEDEYSLSELGHSGLASRVAVGDWNGDGVPDVVIGNFSSLGALGVVYGPLDRAGPLPVQRFWPRDQIPFEGHIRQPVLADWDGDGLLDLVFVGNVGDREARSKGVFWMRNVGTRSKPALAAPQLLVADKDHRYTLGVCVADWNGDGRLDLITTRTQQKFGSQSDTSQSNRWFTLHNKVWVYLREDR
jgi:hypothetical protein